MNDLTTTLHEVGSRIRDAKNVLLVNPTSADGDSLGSSLALAQYLASIQKPHTLLAHRAAFAVHEFLPGADRIVRDVAELSLSSFDLVCTFDFSDIALSGIADNLASPDTFHCINIDHHATNTLFGHSNLVDAERGATAEIVFDLFTANGWPIATPTATCLLTGILSDTGIFAYRNTTPATLATASALMQCGARPHRIYEYTYRTKNLAMMRLWGRVLSRLDEIPGGVLVTYITQKDLQDFTVDDEATEGVANFLNVADCRAVLVLKERDDGTLKGSFRTTRDDIDVAKLAGEFGGGGHRRAAGFFVDESLEAFLSPGGSLRRVVH